MTEWEKVHEGEVLSRGGSATVEAHLLLGEGKFTGPDWSEITVGLHASEFCSTEGRFYPKDARAFALEILAACDALEGTDEPT